MIVGKTFTVNIHNLSIDECINLLTLEQNEKLVEFIKNLIIIKKLIKVISERYQISENCLIYNMINKINHHCRREFFTIQDDNEYRDEELLRQFKEFQRIHSAKYHCRREELFTIFYAERAITELYY